MLGRRKRLAVARGPLSSGHPGWQTGTHWQLALIPNGRPTPLSSLLVRLASTTLSHSSFSILHTTTQPTSIHIPPLPISTPLPTLSPCSSSTVDDEHARSATNSNLPASSPQPPSRPTLKKNKETASPLLHLSDCGSPLSTVARNPLRTKSFALFDVLLIPIDRHPAFANFSASLWSQATAPV